MNALAAWWHDNALAFIVGASAVLGLGALAVAATHSPIQRRKLAEATITLLAMWLLLALVPSPWRLPWPDSPEPTTLPASIVLAPHAIETVEFTNAATRETREDAAAALDARALLGAGLLVGAVALALRLLVARQRLAVLVRRSVAAPSDVLALAHALPIAIPAVRIVVSREIARPFCCGLLRPTVLLPKRLLSADHDRRAADLRPVLLHEYAHLAQGDLRGQLLFALASTVLFWNPLFWWLRREANLAAELLADDLAVRHCDKRSYVRTLIDLVATPSPTALVRGAALAAVDQPTEFFRRMNMLLQRSESLATHCPHPHNWLRGGCVIALAALASLGWTAPCVTAQDPAKTLPPAASTQPAETKPVEPKPTDASPAETKERTVQVTFIVRGELEKFAQELDKLSLSSAVVTRVAPVGKSVSSPDQARVSKVEQSANATQSTAPAAPVPVGGAPASSAPRTYFAFEDHDVNKVVATIAKISGANILVPATLSGTVTLTLKDVPWREALDCAVAQVGCQVSDLDDKTLLVRKKTAPVK